MLKFWQRIVRSRWTKLLALAGGSHRFWLGTALAATAAVTTVILYTEYFAEYGDKGTYAYYRLISNVGATASSNSNAVDRVLLMNADYNTECIVDNDDFTGVTTGTKSYRSWWEFLNNDAVLLTTYNLVKGTSFNLHAKGNEGRVLWSFTNCRGGNLNPKTSAGSPNDYQNLLPFNKTTARQYGKRASKCSDHRHAGTLVMQNTDNAKIISSCFADGIGTIYLDAVNGFDGYKKGELVVEVAYGVFKTNAWGVVESRNIPDDLEKDAAGNYIAPDEAHCDEVERTGTGGEETLKTNAWNRCAWVRANLVICPVSHGAKQALSTNTIAKMEMPLTGSAGAFDNFYRIYAPVQDPTVNAELAKYCNGPMRLRIRRLDDPPTASGRTNMNLDGSNYTDENGLLILDNIIVSFPAMKAMAIPLGNYVSGGSSRNVIGWTGALSPSMYPKIGEKNLTATAGFLFVTNAPPDPLVTDAWVAQTQATMKYRMRYLSWTNNWSDIALSFQDGHFVSTDTITLPQIPGDFEYYYDTVLDAPYYGYLDYSGTDLGTPGYSERITHIESRFDAAKGAPDGLPSTGTDFFTRLREGSSDQLEYQLEMRWKNKDNEYVSTNLPFYVAADRSWKTFVRTTTNAESLVSFPVGSYDFRIIGVNPACTNIGVAVTEIPWSAKALYPAPDANTWTPITLDAVTGALMFQVVENADPTADPSYTIVHASYQDFNHWSDAVSTNTPTIYVGAFSSKKGKQSGSSAETREFASELPNWTSAAGSNETYWTEKFLLSSTQKPEDGYNGYKAYEEFPSCYTPKGWLARNSQWACSQWRKSVTGGNMALQLGGSQRGSLEFVNTKEMPHGVDQYTLKARLAQAIQFGDFAYYFGGGNLEDLHDYVFTMRAVMGTTAPETAFDGNGSVSLVCCYRPGEGCYEMRAERTDDNEVRLYLYKWSYDAATKEVVPTLLGRHKDTLALWYSNGTSASTYLKSNKEGKTDTDQKTGCYGELFIRCRQSDSTVIIEGGVMNAAKTLDYSSGNPASGTSHYYFKYKDDSQNPYTFGAFGFGSANCPAQFIHPQYYATGSTVTVPDVTFPSKDKDNKDISNPACGNDKVTYPTTGVQDMFQTGKSSKYANWTYQSALFEQKTVNFLKALQATPADGSLELFVNDKSQEVKPISGFVYTNLIFTVRNQADSLLQLVTAKGSGDIVVDDCSFNQWCAASYSDSDRTDFSGLRPTFGCPEHYIYLNGWVSVETGDKHVIAFQPLRAKKNGNENGLLSIRAPLMDGRNDYARDPTMKRGVGLGMFSFTYRNADSNCVLRAQYREEDGSENLARDTASTNNWMTIATYDFSTMSATDRASGTISAYYGLHDYRGVMRIIIDPQVVADAQDLAKNPDKSSAYGSIEITDFLSRDEPPIDVGSWWGWNLRTSGAADERSLVDSDPTSAGLALALNNGVTEDFDIETETKDLYPRHLPFVQTPDFGTNIVGEIAFRARRLPGMAEGLFTEVAILGAKTGAVESENQWVCLTNFLVKTDFYERYSYKTSSDEYAAFRLAVIGVKDLDKGVTNYVDKMLIPNPQRVLIDEIEVSEAVRGQVRFFDVGAFRSPLDKHTYVTNIFDIVQQPMCEESWSVQCEVRPVQLEEEILLDDDTEVTLYWYVGEDKWGYDRWKSDSAARSAKLARIPEQPGFVFRGSYPKAKDAVVDPVFTSGTVVQYMLSVKYKNADGTLAEPYYMSGESGDWTKPSWYSGVDLNAKYGGFAAYTILDSVAYGYAWINEVNLFDGPALNSPATNQFVEVAVPAEADIKGWKLEFITGGLSDAAPLYTNKVVTFSDPEQFPDGVPSRKSGPIASKYVFITAGSPQSCSAELKKQGVIDGAWEIPEGDRGDQLKANGNLDVGMPVGIRLVRRSGIVEHQIVVAGTNRYATGRDPRPRTYSTTNFVAKLNAFDSGKSWYTPWCEDRGTNATLAIGVTNFVGVITNGAVWAHIPMTPGRINGGEYIPPEHPHPLGTMVLLYAQLKGGYIDQSIGSESHRMEELALYIPKGLPDGTNITYSVANWHDLKGVTESSDGRQTPHPEAVGKTGTFSITVAKNASNDVTVVAETQVRSDLTGKYGLTADNTYSSAVLAWLENNVCGKSRGSFRVPGGEIHLAEYHDLADTCVTNLTLTEMYWFDMDPTITGSVFQAGITDTPPPTGVDVVRTLAGGTEIDCKDCILGVLMKIYSKYGEFDPYAPYTLNGVEPGSSSRDNAKGWDAVTFKICYHLMNGLDPLKDPDKIWMPVRYFVFDDNSFDADFKATIQVMDPFYQFPDWEEWKDLPKPSEGALYRFSIDTRKFGAASADILRPDSTF